MTDIEKDGFSKVSCVLAEGGDSDGPYDEKKFEE